MIERFEIKGDWFLPNEKDNAIHGTLIFEPFEASTLELYGSLEDNYVFNQNSEQTIILGITSDGKHVTLYKCLNIFHNIFLNTSEGANKITSKYTVRFVIIGLHAFSQDDLVFNKISSEIFNLGEWIGIHGFKPKYQHSKNLEDYKINLEYELPKSINFEINSEINGRFNFIGNLSDSIIQRHSFNINQKTKLEIISKNGKSLEELLKYIRIFQNFLTLALYKRTYIISISLNCDRYNTYFENGAILESKINLYFITRYFNLHEKPKSSYEMIFNYKKIQPNFSNIIRKWYSNYEMLEPAYNLVLNQFYNGNVFSVNTFLNLAQSAETFHARLHNHLKSLHEQYKKAKENNLNNVPSEYHELLNEQFSFGNDINLHKRLSELTIKYSNEFLDKVIGNKEKFILEVKHNRNYYTHYNTKYEKFALKEEKLYYLSEKLKLLLVCSFLIVVGFDKNKLSSFLNDVKENFYHLIYKDEFEGNNKK